MLKALFIILTSLGLAFIFNFLFFEKVVGISGFIFTLILLVTVVLFGRYQRLSLRRSWWLFALILFFSSMFGIRDNEFLTFLNLCATLGLLMLLARELVGTPVFLMKIFDYIPLVILTPLQMLSSAISTFVMIGQVHSNSKNRDLWLKIIKGIVMALPILVIFGVLFSQADLAFSRFIKGIIDINISEQTLQYIALLTFSFISALSFLSYIFLPNKFKLELSGESSSTIIKTGREIEVMVFLGPISALFLLFIGFQVTYLFGGETNIIDAGFTYAEYARRGFWELLAVATLSLFILLASEKYAGVELKKDKRFHIPALIMIIEVGVVIFSASKRLLLYMDAYGMTMLRFYVAGFIILLLVLFILLAVKFIESKREQFFVFGTLLSIMAFLVTVNLINPDAFIARYNIEQYNKTGKIDVLYLGGLSADAQSWKINLYKKLEGQDKEAIRILLEKQKENLQKKNTNWQSANLSRSKALELLED